MSDTLERRCLAEPSLAVFREGLDCRRTACFRTELVVPEDTAKWQIHGGCKYGLLYDM